MIALTLRDDTGADADVAGALGAALGAGPFDGFEGASRYLDAAEGRRVVVVENGEKLFLRTDEGLARCRRFLKLVGDTSESTLWMPW